MPHYDFFCHACQKTFSKILTIAEHGKEKIKCPHCGSNKVEQRWAEFYAVTSKKVPELYLNRAEADYALRRLRLWFPSHWQSHLRARPHHRPWEDTQTQEEAVEEIP